MVRRRTLEEDNKGIISPCPIPPTPAKERSDAKSPNPSLESMVSKRRIWNWIKSLQFAGVIGMSLLVTFYFTLGIVLLSSSTWFNINETNLHELGNPFGPEVMMGMYYVNPIAPLYNGMILLVSSLFLVFFVPFLSIAKKTRSISGLVGGFFGIILVCMSISLALFPSGSPAGYEVASVASVIFPTLEMVTLILILVSFARFFFGRDKTSSVLIAILTGLMIIFCYSIFHLTQQPFVCMFTSNVLVLISMILGITAFGICFLLFIARGDNFLRSLR